MGSKSDKIKGKVNSAVGKAKKTAGRILDNKKMEKRGVAQEDKGDMQKLSGAIKKGAEAAGETLRKAAKQFKSKERR